MGQPILSTGKRAVTPYYFEKLLLNLYSVEELCYLMVQEVYLLDQDLMDRELVTWLETECELPELATELGILINQRGNLSAFVGLILEFVGFYPEEVIQETENIIRDNANLSSYEKGKAKADYYLGNRKLLLAVQAYRELLESLPEHEVKVRSGVYHNMGVAYAGMFYFKDAAEAFLQAYLLLGDNEMLRCHLSALRMYMKEEEYISYMAEHPEYFVMSQKVEKSLDETQAEYEAGQEYRMLSIVRTYREGTGSTTGNVAPYYREIERICGVLKTQYRELVTKE